MIHPLAQTLWDRGVKAIRAHEGYNDGELRSEDEYKRQRTKIGMQAIARYLLSPAGQQLLIRLARKP